MDFTRTLEVLKAAGRDPAALALATVDLAFPELAEEERAALKRALEAAAIPHWCDAGILAALLEVQEEQARESLAKLQTLSVVEEFPARGEGAVNVHEASRLALRKRMAAEEAERFRLCSSRAVEVFAADATPAVRIEWIFHLLCADPERGASELEELGREWISAARPEDFDALALALGELEENGLVEGRARVWVLLTVLNARGKRGEAARLRESAEETLRLARTERDVPAQAEAYCQVGDVRQAEGKLGEALEAFEQYLTITRRLAEQDPGNAGWRRELAVAWSKVGDVRQAEGKLGEALEAFEQYLTITRRLAAQDPGNAGWQRELAVAWSKVGGVRRAEGKLGEALEAFEQYLEISRRLAEQDPGNAGWQRGLAVAWSKVGDVRQEQGKLGEALEAFEQDLEISRRLAEQDPGNAGWQRDLAVAWSKVGDVRQEEGKLSEALEAFEQDLEITRRLAEQDPGNAGWRRELAVAWSRVGDVRQAEGKLGEALEAYEEVLRVMRGVVEAAPEHPGWRGELEWVERRLEGLRREAAGEKG